MCQCGTPIVFMLCAWKLPFCSNRLIVSVFLMVSLLKTFWPVSVLSSFSGWKLTTVTEIWFGMGSRNGHLRSAYVPLMCHFCCELQVKQKKRQGTSSPDLPSAHSTGCHSQFTVNGSHILGALSHCIVGPPLKQRLKVVIYHRSVCSSVPPALSNILH